MTDNSARELDVEHKVVVNEEDQYSLWFADRDAPRGWRDVGMTGTKQACLEFIARTWTDMRPASLRRVLGA